MEYLKEIRYCSYYDCTKNKYGGLKHFIRYRKLGIKLGFSIGYNVFGYGLHLPHMGTIVVNNTTRAGNFCVFQTSICIGGNGKKLVMDYTSEVRL